MHLIFQESYIISSFMVHIYKRITFRIFFHFFKMLIFGIIWDLKRQKMAQNDKKFCVSLCISATVHRMTVMFGTHEWNYISNNFFHFFKSWFFRFSGKRAKNDLKLLISVCHALYLRNRRSRFLVCRCKIMISPGVFFKRNATL